MAPFYNDASYDYHVSLEAEEDMTSFHTHPQQELPSRIIGVPATNHEAYSGEDGNVYSVPFPQPQISESELRYSSGLQQTNEASGDPCCFQTESNACQPGFIPYSMTSDQLYWMQPS